MAEEVAVTKPPNLFPPTEEKSVTEAEPSTSSEPIELGVIDGPSLVTEGADPIGVLVKGLGETLVRYKVSQDIKVGDFKKLITSYFKLPESSELINFDFILIFAGTRLDKAHLSLGFYGIRNNSSVVITIVVDDELAIIPSETDVPLVVRIQGAQGESSILNGFFVVRHTENGYFYYRQASDDQRDIWLYQFKGHWRIGYRRNLLTEDCQAQVESEVKNPLKIEGTWKVNNEEGKDWAEEPDLKIKDANFVDRIEVRADKTYNFCGIYVLEPLQSSRPTYRLKKDDRDFQLRYWHGHWKISSKSRCVAMRHSSAVNPESIRGSFNVWDYEKNEFKSDISCEICCKAEGTRFGNFTKGPNNSSLSNGYLMGYKALKVNEACAGKTISHICLMSHAVDGPECKMVVYSDTPQENDKTKSRPHKLMAWTDKHHLTQGVNEILVEMSKEFPAGAYWILGHYQPSTVSVTTDDSKQCEHLYLSKSDMNQKFEEEITVTWSNYQGSKYNYYIVFPEESDKKEEDLPLMPFVPELVRQTSTEKRMDISKKVENISLETSPERDMITLQRQESDPIQSPRYYMPCRHTISPESLVAFCKNELYTQSLPSSFVCPDPSCETGWDYWTVREVAALSDKQTRDFELKLSENLIESTMDVVYCPKCKSLLSRTHKGHLKVNCPPCLFESSKEFSFCWKCSSQWMGADPTVCGNEICKFSDKKIREDILEILANCTKKMIGSVGDCPIYRSCPKCGQLINHIEACKHILCTRKNCGIRFCFVCLKSQLNGSWQCGSSGDVCPLAAIQNEDTLPKRS